MARRRTRLSPLALIGVALCVAAPQAMAADTLTVNTADDRPATVSPDRLYEVSEQSAARWSMTVTGVSSYRPGVRDSRQVIGFSRDTNPTALGVTTVWTRTRFKVKTTRVCTKVKGKRRCKNVRRYVRDGVEVAERDIQLNPFVPWEQGPAHPARDAYDLESTILHELGHFAHPTKDNHVFGCENSPMIDAISPGEYWRDSDEWLRYGCSVSTGAKYRLAAPAGPRLRMLHVVNRLP